MSEEGHIVNLQELVSTLLEKGFHPRDIRRQLQQRGISWGYVFSTAADGRRVQIQGNREKARRRQQRQLCDNGDGNLREPPTTICISCPIRKWRGV